MSEKIKKEKFDNTKEQSVKKELHDRNDNDGVNPGYSPLTLPQQMAPALTTTSIPSNYNQISSFTNSESRLKTIKEIISIISKNKNQGGRKKPKKRSMRKKPKKKSMRKKPKKRSMRKRPKKRSMRKRPKKRSRATRNTRR